MKPNIPRQGVRARRCSPSLPPTSTDQPRSPPCYLPLRPEHTLLRSAACLGNEQQLTNALPGLRGRQTNEMLRAGERRAWPQRVRRRRFFIAAHPLRWTLARLPCLTLLQAHDSAAHELAHAEQFRQEGLLLLLLLLLPGSSARCSLFGPLVQQLTRLQGRTEVERPGSVLAVQPHMGRLCVSTAAAK